MSLRQTGGKSVILLAVFCIVSLASQPATASVLQTFGASPRAIAMGNAYAALSDDWSAVFYNPAGLSQVKDLETSAGFLYARPSLDVSFGGGGEDELRAFPGQVGGAKEVGALIAGWVIPIDRFLTKELSIPIRFGTALVLPNFSANTASVAPDRFPQDVIFNDRNNYMSFHMGLSARVLPVLYVGIGVMLAQSTMVEFYEGYNTTDAISIESRFGTPAITAGILFRPSEIFRFGLTYHQKVDERETLVTGRMIEYPTLTDASFFIIDREEREISAGGYWPQEITLGGAWKISQRWLLAASFSWFEWSSYVSPNGLSPLNAFEDIYVPRVGVEYRLTKTFDLRAGFAWEPTPVTAQPAGYNPVGNDRLVNAVGCGWRFSDPLGLIKEPVVLDFVFQFQLMQSRTVSEGAFPPPYTGVDPAIETKGFAICSAISLTTKF